MNISIKYLLVVALGIISYNSIAQTTNITEPDAITLPIHKANIGRATFMADTIPLEKYRESDFLTQLVLKPGNNLYMRVFLGNSLTNYQHQLQPSLTVEQLNKGNYSFAFFIDGKQYYQENVHYGAGFARNKNGRTILTVPLISNRGEDMWSKYLFGRFMLRGGGEDALTTGMHTLKIEIRPYVSIPELKIGDVIASGQIQLIVPVISAADAKIQPIEPNSGWPLSTDVYDKKLIKDLNAKIAQNKFKNISGVVVIKSGKLLLEEYFSGSSRDKLHDPRSVGKTFASAVAGIAIGEGYIKSENQVLKDFYDLKSFKNYSPKKDSVTLKSLLTMSSVFDANDNESESPGNEENMYPTDNWVKFALDLKIDSSKKPYAKWNYFTAGVVVLGDVLNKTVPGGLDKYADNKLFKPLQITNYKWQYTPQHVANTAGGIQLRALDFAKFGQLYKNNGVWNGRRIIPAEWVKKSFTKQIALPADVVGPGFYGYLFWNKTYIINNKAYETWYCTGNGGNKIFIFKNVPLVIVVTAAAYNEAYAHSQVDKMMQDYILPALLK